jgi:hypothetical protein
MMMMTMISDHEVINAYVSIGDQQGQPLRAVGYYLQDAGYPVNLIHLKFADMELRGIIVARSGFGDLRPFIEIRKDRIPTVDRHPYSRLY